VYPGTFAAWAPDKPAIVAASPSGDTVVTYGELDAWANRAARVFRSLGLEAGDHVARHPTGKLDTRILRDEYLTPLGPLDRAMEAMAPVTGMCSHA